MPYGFDTYWWLVALAALAVVVFFVLSAIRGSRESGRDRRAGQMRREERPPPDMER